MSNPLIALRAKSQIDATEPLYSGFESRSLKRQTDEKQALRRVLATIEKKFPKLFHSTPVSYPDFTQTWNENIFPDIVNAVKSKSHLAKVNNAIVNAINQGNAQQLWQLQVPTTLVQQKRDRPFRSRQWLSHSQTLIYFEQKWLVNIQKSDSDETKLAHCIISAALHSGLSETRHLEALSECLQQQPKPLNVFEDLVWIDLNIRNERDNKKRHFPFSCNDQRDDTPILVSRFFPTSMTLSFIASYLNSRGPGTTDYSANNLIKSALQTVGIKHISYSQFCKAAIGVSEIKPSVAIPEAMLEYAVKRNMAYSLTEANWLGLFKDYNAIELPKIKSVPQSHLVSAKKTRSHHQHHVTLLSDLLQLLRLKQNSQKRSEKMALNEMRSTFGELKNLPLNEQVLLSWIRYLLKTKKLSTAKRYFDAIGTIWLSETRDIDLENHDIDFHALYTGMLEVAHF